MPTKTKPISKYKATLIIAGRKTYAEGKDVTETIALLTPLVKRGKAILTIEKDGKSREKVFMPNVVNRVFNSHGVMRDIALKQISIFFSDL